MNIFISEAYIRQPRTLKSKSRDTPSTTTTTTSNSTTSNETTVEPKPTKIPIQYPLYEKPAWTLKQIQKQYFKSNGSRYNLTISRPSSDNVPKYLRSAINETGYTKTIDFGTNETVTEVPTTVYTTNTTLDASNETTYETTDEATQEILVPKHKEAHTIPAQNELYHFFETTSEATKLKLLHKSIYYTKVNRKPTIKRQTHRTRRLHARPVYNTSKLLAFL